LQLFGDLAERLCDEPPDQKQKDSYRQQHNYRLHADPHCKGGCYFPQCIGSSVTGSPQAPRTNRLHDAQIFSSIHFGFRATGEFIQHGILNIHHQGGGG